MEVAGSIPKRQARWRAIAVAVGCVIAGCGESALDSAPSSDSNAEVHATSVAEVPATLVPIVTSSSTSPHESAPKGVASTVSSPLATIDPTEIADAAVWSIGADQSLDPDTQSFTALVMRLGCNGGVTGEVYAPTVSIGDADIIVTFSVEWTPGGNCPGNDQVPFVVDIGQPIGDRQLVDGACLPDGEAVSTSFCVDGGIRR